VVVYPGGEVNETPAGDGYSFKYVDVVPYRNPQKPDQGFDPNDPNPKTAGCPAYVNADAAWPQTCPNTPLTYAVVRSQFQEALDYGNSFRINRGYVPLVMNDFLILAAQRHATFLAEHWDMYLADPPGEMFLQYGGLCAHYEPDAPALSFGVTVGARITNTGFTNMGRAAEGIGYNWSVFEALTGANNPMGGLCTQQSDYTSDVAAGHFGEWTSHPETRSVGYGNDSVVDIGPETQAWNIHVFVYSAELQVGDPVPLAEDLPKFACPPPY
jgi:hypothetical protein